MEDNSSEDNKKFSDYGVCETLCQAIDGLGWKSPSAIQKEVLRTALLEHQDRDIIAIAETGSGKTGAFAIPVIQRLVDNPQRMYALVVTPTRELAFQISEQFEALGASVGLKTAVIVGGVDMVQQALALARKPHVVVATPGRLVDHLENTKGFSLKSMKFLILDEADRCLSMDFEEAIDKILSCFPKERTTYLFSATMTQKVVKLQRASLHDPVKLQVSSKYQTVSTLIQQYLFIPAKYKECYLAYVMNEFRGKSTIIFVSTCNSSQLLTIFLRTLGFKAVCINGNLTQVKRLGALSKFKEGSRNILIATDVASRGLDIPEVDLVLNYDIPGNGKDYIHRVGRTARAGKSGRAISFVTQYDVESYQRIEKLIGKKLEAYPCSENEALTCLQTTTEALQVAQRQMKEEEKKGKKGRHRDGGDEEDSVMDSFRSKKHSRKVKRERN